jgi:CRP-like cAMP-binding protein
VTIDGTEGPVVVGRLWPGDYFGEMSLFTGEPRSAHVATTEPTVLFEVRKETMARIFANNPSLVEKIAEMIEAREKANESALSRPSQVAASDSGATSILARIRRFFRL